MVNKVVIEDTRSPATIIVGHLLAWIICAVLIWLCGQSWVGGRPLRGALRPYQWLHWECGSFSGEAGGLVRCSASLCFS